MADNVTTIANANATLAAGTVISTEEVTTLNGVVVPAQQLQRLIPALRTADGTAVDVTASAPLPVTMSLPTGAATETSLAAVLAKLSADPATQTTLAAVLAKLSADPATQTTLAAVLAKIIAAPSTEAKQDTGNTSLASILAKIIAAPATEAKQDTGNTSLTTLAGAITAAIMQANVAKINNVTPLMGNGVTGTGSQRVTIASDNTAFSVNAALAASELHIGEVGGKTVTVGVERTRPADTTAYAALDAVADSTTTPTSITFAGMSRVASGSGYITKARIVTDQSANVAQFRLWLFNAAPNTLQNDNAAYLIKYADKLTCIGYIDFPACSTEAGSDSAQALNDNLRLAYTADASSQLLGVLQTRTAFTPANAQKIYIVLVAEQN